MFSVLKSGFNRLMLEHGVACVTVSFPATGLTGGRVRFCLSAAHTREMLDQALSAMDVCGDMCGIRYSQINPHRSLKEVFELEKRLEQDGQKQEKFPITASVKVDEKKKCEKKIWKN